MNPERFDLNLFRIFDAIYQEGNLTRASEVLHMTQPAVSNALARLRSNYDDPLFVRSATGMAPTPLAETIAADVRRALQMLAGSVCSTDFFDPLQSERRFRLLAGDLTSAMLIPRLVQYLGEIGSNVQIDVAQLHRDSVVHELAAGQADFAFDAFPFTDPQVMSMKVLEDAHVCAVRPDHPNVGQRISLNKYLELEHVHASSRRRGLGQIDIALRRLGKQRRIVVRTQFHLGLPHIVAVSDLLASIPRSLADAHKLKTLKLPFAAPAAEVHAFWHKSTDADAASRWFRSLLGSGFKLQG